MSKIYVLTQGEYSDYSIVGIFSTREKAEVAKGGNENGYIEEHELDNHYEKCKDGKKFWYVAMRRDGTAFDGTPIIGGFPWEKSSISVQPSWERPSSGHTGMVPGGFHIVAHVHAFNEQGAVKAANEMRAKLIASGEWAAEVTRLNALFTP